MDREVRELRDKIAKKREGLLVFIEKGIHPSREYEQGLKSQEATFDYVIRQLDDILAATSEPIR